MGTSELWVCPLLLSFGHLRSVTSYMSLVSSETVAWFQWSHLAWSNRAWVTEPGINLSTPEMLYFLSQAKVWRPCLVHAVSCYSARLIGVINLCTFSTLLLEGYIKSQVHTIFSVRLSLFSRSANLQLRNLLSKYRGIPSSPEKSASKKYCTVWVNARLNQKVNSELLKFPQSVLKRCCQYLSLDTVRLRLSAPVCSRSFSLSRQKERQCFLWQMFVSIWCCMSKPSCRFPTDLINSCFTPYTKHYNNIPNDFSLRGKKFILDQFSLPCSWFSTLLV